MQNETRVPYHAIGMGDVFLTRKLPQIYSPELRGKVQLRSLVDVYPEERLASPDALRVLFAEIKQKHIKGKLEDAVADELMQAICSGEVKYFRANSPESYKPFFDFVNSIPGSAIDISSPNKTHLDIFSRSLSESNAHISIEKPVVPYKNDLITLTKLLAAHSAGRVLMDAEHYSYYGNIRHYVENFERYIDGSWVENGNPVPLGKVKGLILRLQETEGFESKRNQNIVDIRSSCGGILLDLGPHCFSFFKCLGGNIDSSKIVCKGHKANFEQIATPYHRETEAEAECPITGPHFLEDATVKIRVGKALPLKKKNFYVFHEKGTVDLSVDDRRLTIYDADANRILNSFYPVDAFGNAINSFVDRIQHPQKPVATPISRAIDYLMDLFTVQDAMVMA